MDEEEKEGTEEDDDKHIVKMVMVARLLLAAKLLTASAPCEGFGGGPWVGPRNVRGVPKSCRWRAQAFSMEFWVGHHYGPTKRARGVSIWV